MNSLCLTKNPEWRSYKDCVDGYKNTIHDGEYKTIDLSGKWLPLHNYDVLCSVCLVRKKNPVLDMFQGFSVY